MNTSNNKWYNLFLFEGSKKMLALLLVCLGISAYLGTLTPGLIANLSKNYSDQALFNQSLLFLLFNFVAVYVNRVAYQLAVNKYIRLLIQYARSETYGRWLKNNDYDGEKYPQGEILSRIMSDTEAIRDLITSGAFGIFIDLCFVASCLVGFIALNTYTGIFIGVTEVLATIGLIWGSQLMRDIFIKLRNTQAKVNRVTANVLGGFNQIYYTRHDNYASNKSNEAFMDFLEKQNKANNMDAAYYAVAESLYPILLALIIFVIPHSGIIEAALIFAIVDLIQRSIMPIKEISGKIASVQRAYAGIERIQQFLIDMPPLSVAVNQLLLTGGHRVSSYALKEMSVDIKEYKYPLRKNEAIVEGKKEFSLKDISFKGKAGELIAIVGLSGSGKSTLLSILAGNVIAPEAKVKLVLQKENEEIVLGLEDSEEYRQEVSIVSQESHIFSESLAFNITMKRDLSTEELGHFEKEWAKMCEAIPYLKTMNIGPSEKIQPNTLSLGQKQLLAGVRACYLKKNVVFIDEISSALDSGLEYALRKCILLIQEFSLTFIVAHRVETIINASLILVMENGRIVNSGKHSELLSSSKVYKEFIQELSHS